MTRRLTVQQTPPLVLGDIDNMCNATTRRRMWITAKCALRSSQGAFFPWCLAGLKPLGSRSLITTNHCVIIIIFCDNEAVFKNASIAESRLTKKHNSICFHRVREAVASRILMPFKVDSKYNLSDILTKSLSAEKRIAMRKMIMPEHGKWNENKRNNQIERIKH